MKIHRTDDIVNAAIYACADYSLLLIYNIVINPFLVNTFNSQDINIQLLSSQEAPRNWDEAAKLTPVHPV